MNTPCPLPDDLHQPRMGHVVGTGTEDAAKSVEVRGYRRALAESEFHPDQPRVLAGNSDGGQWTDEGGGSDSGGLVQNVRQDVQSPLNPFKPLTGGGGAGRGAALLYLPYMLRRPDEFPSPLPLEDGLAEFNRLSKQNDPTKQPIIHLQARKGVGTHTISA